LAVAWAVALAQVWVMMAPAQVWVMMAPALALVPVWLPGLEIRSPVN
jgi:hypothetical protein